VTRAACLAALLALLAAAPARAWTQAVTRETPQQPLHIGDSNCVPMTLHADGSADLPFADLQAAVAAGLAVWNDVPGAYIAFTTTTPASCCRAEFLQQGANANCIRWLEDDWPAEYPPAGIALTTITYAVDDGRILDADIEFNGADFSFGTDCAAGLVDVWNTTAHEAGHVVGLDHSSVPGATMRPRSYPGDCDLRDLTADDIEGLSTIYPPAADPGTCREPRGGLNLDCSPPPEDCGCRAPGARPAPWTALLAVAALAGWRAGRRRR
jgi:hypothetical protein